MTALNFTVALETADGTTNSSAAKIEDNRSLVERMFTVLNKETAKVEPMEIKVIDCATGTAHEQGINTHKLGACIIVLTNYKRDVEAFKGATKGRNFVLLGKRPGGAKYGNPGLMIDLEEIGQLRELLGVFQQACGASPSIPFTLPAEAEVVAAPQEAEDVGAEL